MKKTTFLVALLTIILAICFLLTAKTQPVAAQTQTRRLVILQFSDIGDFSLEKTFATLAKWYRYYKANNERVIVVGSGDYVLRHNYQTLGAFKSKVDEFVARTGCPPGHIVLALGNHDDPAATSTYIWNKVWENSRKPEGVVRNGNLIIAWMHSERPNLDRLETKLREKRALCPKCLGILVGHMPLVLEPRFSAYQNFLLPPGWRQRTLEIIRSQNIKLYLTGHFEMHGFFRKDGTWHNRATPARLGIDVITITYNPETGRITEIISRPRAHGENPENIRS